MNINNPSGGLVLPGFNRKNRNPESVYSDRLPGLHLLPNRIRGHVVASCGEFVGTFLFLFFAFSGTQVANTQVPAPVDSPISLAANPAQLLYISLVFGFSLAVNAWVFFRISGGLFNPCVTLGMCLIGALSYIRGAFLVMAQLLGAMTSAAVVSALFPGPLNVRTSLRVGTSIAQGLFIEMFLTAQLVFTIYMLAAEKHKATFIAPVGIGLSLFVAELSGVFYTGGSLNPARSFAPEVVDREFYHYHWIYWVGPTFGTLLATGLYKLLKMLEYETANPGQDASRMPTMYKPDDTNSPHPGEDDDTHHAHFGNGHHPQTDGANGDEDPSIAPGTVVTKPIPIGFKNYFGKKQARTQQKPIPGRANLIQLSSDDSYQSGPETEAQAGPSSQHQ